MYYIDGPLHAINQPIFCYVGSVENIQIILDVREKILWSTPMLYHNYVLIINTILQGLVGFIGTRPGAQELQIVRPESRVLKDEIYQVDDPEPRKCEALVQKTEIHQVDDLEPRNYGVFVLKFETPQVKDLRHRSYGVLALEVEIHQVDDLERSTQEIEDLVLEICRARFSYVLSTARLFPD
ncbi:uncharacterized protein [Neodiprion pinetum]|uniref:uncharacterized protein n=1 Tax=Neodiprion pinetum TaxID=441929 RepID=UPI003720886D